MLYPNLFKPMRIKNTVFRNRILAAPNGTKHKTVEGAPMEFEVAVFESRAKGGAAQVTTGNSVVDPNYRYQKPSCTLSFADPDMKPALTEVALAIRRHGAVASVELIHPGHLSNPADSGGRNPIGPSAYVRGDGVQVEEMTEEDIEHAIEAFADSAEFAQSCFFDMCLVHGGHGWMISSFFSRRFNRRTDRWGGSLENRARFAVEVCRRIRQRCGDDFLIEFRMSATEFAEDGITLEESVEFARILEPHIDLLHVSAAGLSTAHHNPNEMNDPKTYAEIWSHCPSPHVMNERGCYIQYAEAMKKAGIKVPVVAIGAISDPAMAERAIAEGKCDFVAVARQLIADPELPNKAKAGLVGEIRPCIRCEKCNDRHVTRQCTVNPEMGRFMRLLYVDRHPRARRVAVVGGGPGGMQAAITARQQGHDVTLFEKDGELGGMMRYIGREFLKREMPAYTDYMVRHTVQSAKVLLHTEATPELLKSMEFDHIIAAVGAEPIIPKLPGYDKKHVVAAPYIKNEGVVLGANVAIIGGGISGCEIAYCLSREGKKVTIVEMLDTLQPERDRIHRNYSMPILAALKADPNVTIFTGTRCLQIGDDFVTVETPDGILELPADSVVMAVGNRARTDVVDSLWDCAPEFRPIGDCVRPRFILDATSEGFFAALDIR